MLFCAKNIFFDILGLFHSSTFVVAVAVVVVVVVVIVVVVAVVVSKLTTQLHDVTEAKQWLHF
jgi:hypothetical protein